MSRGRDVCSTGSKLKATKMKHTQRTLSVIAAATVFMIIPDLRSADPNDDCLKDLTGGTCIGPQTAMCANYCTEVIAVLTKATYCGTEKGPKHCTTLSSAVGGTQIVYWGWLAGQTNAVKIDAANVSQCDGCTSIMIGTPTPITQPCMVASLGSDCPTSGN